MLGVFYKINTFSTCSLMHACSVSGVLYSNKTFYHGPLNHSTVKATPLFLHPQPFPKRQILNSSKLKELADDICKFDENDRKLSKRVENTAGKGEIARYEQVLLFPQCFQKT